MPAEILAPVFGVTYAVEHDFLTQTLTIRAEGEIADILNDPFFVRDRWLGGLKYSLKTTPKGEVGTPVQRHFVAKPYKEHTFLIPGLDYILIETATGITKVPINKIQLTPPTANGEVQTLEATQLAEISKPADVGDVLPPISIYLPGGETHAIKVPIPKPFGLWVKANINTAFDSESLQIADVEVNADDVTFYIKWVTLSDLPKSFSIITTQWNGLIGPDGQTSRIIQPYIFHFVIFKQK
ncbi:hypothetical protein B0H67DRAFT_551752 [Lasiosphaeris hirsuta]|uniref:Uncharacterized protein n=1 Tax=Lasiosphaeris hirsuta TaxID=260670 RepID=A0AA40AP06_9PEZI|nr:hypothetical protein B0H67DRAFT_551752 [Lasiosphaeris hirsuta]